MLNFDFVEEDLRILSPPHFMYDFLRKMFLMLYSIKSVSLPEISFIAIVF